MGVPLFDTATPLAALRGQLRGAVERVLDSGRYILGPEVAAFERELAAYCATEHVVVVAHGTAATFSFFPSKNLGCFGDGGAIATADEEIAERARTLRFHGPRDKVSYEQIGYNSRLDELQAAILRVQLPHLDEMAAGRL